MPKEKFNPSPAEQFGDEGLPNRYDDKGEDRTSKGPHDERVQGGIVAGQRDIRGKLRKDKDYSEKDFVDLEQLPNTNAGEETNEEEKIIDIIAAREELAEKERRLAEGKANIISMPKSSPEKGIRQFKNVGELLDFNEKRQEAKEKARRRHEEEKQKKSAEK